MDDAEVYRQGKVLLFISKVVIWTWTWLVIWILGIIALIFFNEPLLFGIAFAIFFPSSAFYIFMAFRIKCQGCNKFVTVHPLTTPKFVTANTVKGINGWSGIILNVLLYKKFTCMHCGRKFVIEI